MSLFSPDELEAIRLIDQRQNQLLDDLDSLNVRILAILKEHGFANEAESAAPGERSGFPQFHIPEGASEGDNSLESAA